MLYYPDAAPLRPVTGFPFLQQAEKTKPRGTGASYGAMPRGDPSGVDRWLGASHTWRRLTFTCVNGRSETSEGAAAPVPLACALDSAPRRPGCECQEETRGNNFVDALHHSVLRLAYRLSSDRTLERGS